MFIGKNEGVRKTGACLPLAPQTPATSRHRRPPLVAPHTILTQEAPRHMNNSPPAENNPDANPFIIRYRFRDAYMSMYRYLEVSMVTENDGGEVEMITCQLDLDIATKNDQRVFWSLYGINKDGTYECIGDFLGREWTMGVAVRLGGVPC